MTRPKASIEGRNLETVKIHNGRDRAVLLSKADPETGVAVVRAQRLDFLDDWVDAGRITKDQWQVGRDFQAHWYAAGHRERYRSAFDLVAAPSRGGRGISYDGLAGGVDAENYVRRALEMLGPDQHSVVINVLGFEKSFRQCVEIWRQNGKTTNVDRLTGVMEAALETLAGRILRGTRK